MRYAPLIVAVVAVMFQLMFPASQLLSRYADAIRLRPADPLQFVRVYITAQI
jgi:hypothetical protein